MCGRVSGQEICLHATRGRSENYADISSYVKRGQSDGRKPLCALPNTIGPMESKKFGVAVAIVQGIAYAMRQIKVDTLVDILCNVRVSY